jgi:uncharacterized protein YfkK (UPF0435 family)
MKIEELNLLVDQMIEAYQCNSANSKDLGAIHKMITDKIKMNVEKRKYNEYRNNNDKIDFFEDGK